MGSQAPRTGSTGPAGGCLRCSRPALLRYEVYDLPETVYGLARLVLSGAIHPPSAGAVDPDSLETSVARSDDIERISAQSLTSECPDTHIILAVRQEQYIVGY